jgi:L-lactate dehydrogenase complex protein LldG
MSDVAVATSVWSRFTAKAELVGAVVMRTGSPQTVASLLRENAAEFFCTASVSKRFPRVAGVVGTNGSSEPSAEVVAVAEFAVAETGSVALDEPADDRGACFLSERLWVLVAEQDIVTTLDAGIQRMGDLVRAGARHPVLMTGPSRTADIERVLTIGVHGPRALVIVVVGGA